MSARPDKASPGSPRGARRERAASAAPAKPRRPAPALAPLDLSGRIGHVREMMAQAGCDALLISKLANVRYLTGFTGSAGTLLVRSDDAVLVTDGRYGTQAPAEVARGGSGAKVEAVPAVEQPQLLRALAEGTVRVGLEAEHIAWAAQRRASRGWAKGKKLVPTTGLVEGLRRGKDAAELARIAVAAAVADEALAHVRPLLDDLPAEAEFALALDAEMRWLGAEAPAFETIVAAGPNGAEPHHRPSSRRARAGELVVLDFGARSEGYCSDMTRTVVVSGGQKPSKDLRRLLAVVNASQDAGLAAVREGVPAREVDWACREVVEAAGWGALFVHGTGHGIGLEVHEAPALSRTSDDILRSGQVVTVEPGVYVPGLGGARTEDTVVVTESGCQVLTLASK